MHSLIIVIISIALVAAIAVSTLFFGGDAVTSGNSRALAAARLNELNQTAAAVEYFRSVNHRLPNTMQELLDGDYLRTVPNQEIFFEPDYVVVRAESLEQCQAVNQQLNYQETPSCAELAHLNDVPITVCCTRPVPEGS